MHIWRRLEVSVCCLGSFALLLLLVQDDADDVPLVILHVLHQMFFACGLEATDAAAEQEDAVFHSRSWNGSLGLGEGWVLHRHAVLWRLCHAWEHTPRAVHRQTYGRHGCFSWGFDSVLWWRDCWRTFSHHVHGCRPLWSSGEDRLSHWEGTAMDLNLISLSDSCTLLTRAEEKCGAAVSEELLPAALGDGLINSFVHLLIVVVLVSGVLPHVWFQRRWVTAHVATQWATGRNVTGALVI